MHQISLLGGLGDARHGGGSHYMRPDRVYATSVLQPMQGYIPGYDVQQVATEFTLGPQTGMTLSGLRGLSGWDKLKVWWHGVKARARGGAPSYRAAAAAQTAAAASAAPAVAGEAVVHAPGASAPPGRRTGWAGDEIQHGYEMAPAYVTAYRVGPFARGIPAQAVHRAYGMSSSLPDFAQDAVSKATMMRWRGLRMPWG